MAKVVEVKRVDNPPNTDGGYSVVKTLDDGTTQSVAFDRRGCEVQPSAAPSPTPSAAVDVQAALAALQAAEAALANP